MATFGFTVHALGSKQVRVLFDSHVTSTAIAIAAYTITSLAPPGTAITPAIDSVKFYDDTERSVVLDCSLRLTTGTLYSIQISGVKDIDGNDVSAGAKNFTANVIDPPRVLGSYLSKRGCVDILFDRPVGLTSLAATAFIRDAAGGPGVAMTLVTWVLEQVLPDTSLRFALPIGMPTANAYLIDFNNVIDESLNTGSGTTDLELILRSPLPYDYIKITQLQIIDAYVADVSNDFLQVATVRVYFNGPVLSTDFTNWTASKPGPHVNTDTANAVIAPDAIGLPTLITLVNDIKAKLNAHLTASSVHIQDDSIDIVISPNAFDLQSSIDLVNEIQPKLLAHYSAKGVHVYVDNVNTFGIVIVSAGDLILAEFMANTLKAKYNGHLTASYSVNFDGIYTSTTPLGYVFDFSSLSTGRAFPVETPLTYFADLHLSLDSNDVPITLAAALTSDDGFSVTNPADYTGSIIARPGNSHLTIVTNQIVIDESMSILTDREIIIDNPDFVSIVQSDGSLLRNSLAKLTATLPSVIWALNQLMFAYSYHISGTPSDSAGHQEVDFANLLIVGDYCSLPTLIDANRAANLFRAKLNSHMSNSTFHFHPEYDLVGGSDAIDIDTLVILVANIRNKFLAHNIRIGPHNSPGWRIFAARLFDKITIDIDRMVDGEFYTFQASLRDVYHENSDGGLTPGSIDRKLGSFVYHEAPFQISFEGKAILPSLSSALPRPGIVSMDSGVRLESDSVEVFFSKPMHQVSLDSTNLIISGGSIIMQDWSWKDSRTASIRVINMTPISYTVQALGLTDESGNPTYP